jgi:hypothetical protein
LEETALGRQSKKQKRAHLIMDPIVGVAESELETISEVHVHADWEQDLQAGGPAVILPSCADPSDFRTIWAMNNKNK